MRSSWALCESGDMAAAAAELLACEDARSCAEELVLMFRF